MTGSVRYPSRGLKRPSRFKLMDCAMGHHYRCPGRVTRRSFQVRHTAICTCPCHVDPAADGG